jgi:hypothetical protein
LCRIYGQQGLSSVLHTAAIQQQQQQQQLWQQRLLQPI